MWTYSSLVNLLPYILRTTGHIVVSPRTNRNNVTNFVGKSLVNDIFHRIWFRIITVRLYSRTRRSGTPLIQRNPYDASPLIYLHIIILGVTISLQLETREIMSDRRYYRFTSTVNSTYDHVWWPINNAHVWRLGAHRSYTRIIQQSSKIKIVSSQYKFKFSQFVRFVLMQLFETIVIYWFSRTCTNIFFF